MVGIALSLVSFRLFFNSWFYVFVWCVVEWQPGPRVCAGYLRSNDALISVITC